jgi:hypothetical protein
VLDKKILDVLFVYLIKLCQEDSHILLVRPQQWLLNILFNLLKSFHHERLNTKMIYKATPVAYSTIKKETVTKVNEEIIS